MRSLIVLAVGGSFLMAACSDPAVEYDDVAGAPDLAPYAKTSDLHAVAQSGSYDDLTGKPDLAIFAMGDDLTAVARSGEYADLIGTPDLSVYAPAELLAPVAFSGSYGDLAGLPDLSVYAPAELLSPVAFSGTYGDLAGLPDLSVYAPAELLSPVAFSGSYGDLAGRPDLSVYAPAELLAPVAFSGTYEDLTGLPDLSIYAAAETLSPVATSGSYADLTGLPDLSVYATAESLPTVAVSGSYGDLVGLPDLSVYAAAESLSQVAVSNSYDDLDGRPWTGNARRIHTNAAVSIGGEGSNPLTVHVADYGFTEVDQIGDEGGVMYAPAVSHWQSFTPAVAGVLVGIDIHRHWEEADTGYTLNIYEGEGTGGTLIHSESDLFVRSGYHTLAVAPVRLEASAQYTWELVHASPFMLVGYSWASYEGGRGGGTNEPGMDYHFATHMRRDLGSSSARLTVTASGKVGVGNATPTAALDVAGDLRVRSSSSPASDDPCHQGQITWDGGYVYICVQTNEWKRAALSAY